MPLVWSLEILVFDVLLKVSFSFLDMDIVPTDSITLAGLFEHIGLHKIYELKNHEVVQIKSIHIK